MTPGNPFSTCERVARAERATLTTARRHSPSPSSGDGSYRRHLSRPQQADASPPPTSPPRHRYTDLWRPLVAETNNQVHPLQLPLVCITLVSALRPGACLQMASFEGGQR
jgi:hypothetical protein